MNFVEAIALACQFLRTLLPVIDRGGNCSGNVLLGLLDLSVVLESNMVSS
jgi:hypothetical protein